MNLSDLLSSFIDLQERGPLEENISRMPEEKQRSFFLLGR